MKVAFIFLFFSFVLSSCQGQTSSTTKNSNRDEVTEKPVAGNDRRVDINDYKNRLNTIGHNDQQRQKNDWSKQNPLDSLNRIELDKLYDEYGFPNLELLGKDALTQAIMVAHHSTDCEWNEKWLIRFLDHHEELAQHHNLVSYMIKRTFDLNSGFCRVTSETQNKIKSHYDQELISKYGIEKMLE